MVEYGVIIAVIVGISQVIKTATPIKAKFIPIINLVLGAVLGVFFLTADLKMNILYGIILGLSASGLYDQTKIIK